MDSQVPDGAAWLTCGGQDELAEAVWPPEPPPPTEVTPGGMD